MELPSNATSNPDGVVHVSHTFRPTSLVSLLSLHYLNPELPFLYSLSCVLLVDTSLPAVPTNYYVASHPDIVPPLEEGVLYHCSTVT